MSNEHIDTSSATPCPSHERTIHYYDERFGDTYVVTLVNEKFSHCARYLDKIGRDPIWYYALSEIPAAQRHAIENLLP
jgi:hypothetical protein